MAVESLDASEIPGVEQELLAAKKEYFLAVSGVDAGEKLRVDSHAKKQAAEKSIASLEGRLSRLHVANVDKPVIVKAE